MGQRPTDHGVTGSTEYPSTLALKREERFEDSVRSCPPATPTGPANVLSAHRTVPLSSQQVGGGWDYSSDTSTGRSDMSVTGWVVMALKSLTAGGVRVPDSTCLGIVDFVVRATRYEGHVSYARTSQGEVVDTMVVASFQAVPRLPRLSPTTLPTTVNGTCSSRMNSSLVEGRTPTRFSSTLGFSEHWRREASSTPAARSPCS